MRGELQKIKFIINEKFGQWKNEVNEKKRQGAQLWKPLQDICLDEAHR